MRLRMALLLGLASSLGFAFTACNGDMGSSELLSVDALQRIEHPIIHGEPDKTKGHAGVVSLFMDISGLGAQSYSSCTGTLIHPQWVLTAAHCVAEVKNGKPVALSNNRYFRIAVGNNLNDLSSSSNMYSIDKIIYHPNYLTRYVESNGHNYYTSGNDIALIKLKKPIPSTDIKPIKTLPKWLGINRTDISHGLKAEFVGYGYDEFGNTDTKLKTTTAIRDYCGGANNDPSDGCKHGDVRVTGCHPSPTMCEEPSYAKYCTTGFFCFTNAVDRVWLSHGTLYFEKDPGGTCQGDSGGPAFVNVGGEEYVAGLTSYGDAACAKVSVSTATQDFYDWIIAQAPEVAGTYVEICGNGVDDDGNGVSDCADPACASDANCEPEICDNKIDDNHNGPIDCDDPVCSRDPACNFGIVVTDAENCFNGIDDNMDGDIDCGDVQCKYTDRCKVELNTDSSEATYNSGCQSAPNAPTQLPLGMMLLGLIGAGALISRRKSE